MVNKVIYILITLNKKSGVILSIKESVELSRASKSFIETGANIVIDGEAINSVESVCGVFGDCLVCFLSKWREIRMVSY